MTADAYPNPTNPFGHAMMDLFHRGRDLIGRIRGALTTQNTDHLPRTLAKNPATAEARVTRALDWLFALTRTLAGDRFYLPAEPTPPRPPKSPPRPRASVPRSPKPRTQTDRELEQLRRIRATFATQPIGRIYKRICRQLGVREGSDPWHPTLTSLTETPQHWNTRHRAAEAKFTADHPQLPPPHEAAIPAGRAVPPAFHRRE